MAEPGADGATPVAATPAEAEKVEVKAAPMADTPAAIWQALGIQDEPTQMAMLGRQQAMVAENAITCIGRNIHGMKIQATKTKSELTQTKQVQSVHAKDIEELKKIAGDNSAIDDLKAEIAAVKKQAFEVPLLSLSARAPRAVQANLLHAVSGQPSDADAAHEHAQ